MEHPDHISDDFYQSWKLLAQELMDDDHHLEHDLVLVLIKILLNAKSKYHPLEIAFDLGRSKKFPNLMNFLREDALWAGPSSESPIESSEVFKGFWHYSLPTGYSMEPREASNPPTTHLLKNKNLIQPR